MEVKISELRKGDEVLVLGQVSKYVKVLSDPKLNPEKSKIYGKDMYKTVKVVYKKETKTITSTRKDWRTNPPTIVPYTYTKSQYKLETPDENDVHKSIDLNFHRLWLVKRENDFSNHISINI